MLCFIHASNIHIAATSISNPRIGQRRAKVLDERGPPSLLQGPSSMMGTRFSRQSDGLAKNKQIFLSTCKTTRKGRRSLLTTQRRTGDIYRCRKTDQKTDVGNARPNLPWTLDFHTFCCPFCPLPQH